MSKSRSSEELAAVVSLVLATIGTLLFVSIHQWTIVAIALVGVGACCYWVYSARRGR
jgi:hypothetical protein